MAYHHGNARAALLDAAATLLEQTGAAGLSLRQIAETAGLSRQAPYNHFENKAALLAALANTGFRTLIERMTSAPEAVSARERLAIAAEGYIAFGTEQPALFRLMFGRELVDLRAYPEAWQSAQEALARLSEIVAALDPGSDPTDATLIAWSLVHGYTALCVETGLEPPERRHRQARAFAQAVEAYVQRKSHAGSQRADRGDASATA